MGLLKPGFGAPTLLPSLGLCFPISEMGVGKKVGRHLASPVLGDTIQLLFLFCLSHPLFSCSFLLLSWGRPGSFLRPPFLPPCRASAAFPPLLSGLALSWLREGAVGKEPAERQVNPLGKQSGGLPLEAAARRRRGQGPWGLFVSKVTGVRAGC